MNFFRFLPFQNFHLVLKRIYCSILQTITLTPLAIKKFRAPGFDGHITSFHKSLFISLRLVLIAFWMHFHSVFPLRILLSSRAWLISEQCTLLNWKYWTLMPSKPAVHNSDHFRCKLEARLIYNRSYRFSHVHNQIPDQVSEAIFQITCQLKRH